MPGQLYPLFLSLEGFSVLIIGFGSVGRRKLAMLIPAAPASVTIIDPPRAGRGRRRTHKERRRSWYQRADFPRTFC